ncbi:hypothetical protein AYO21_11067 [Fonsecaea monophora]|uniref:U4/U6.U5 small nuclear ribonucleoprotein 27kDa protein domain-containing protein n=1 Tax=Fonsecaea monophora TaxID=254056 RepID=A0A177ESZ9_9EURO|nr:hypothetical protein AYO21_11067 [Fonsecaea monophora]OAG34766.1 hypothetical protein AYO21_11067 [Fonsecaea monophora]
MDERPAKRTKRTTSAAMWDENETPDSLPSSSGRDHKPKPRDTQDEDRRGPRRDDERRRRSRSRDTPDGRRDRSRSRERPAHQIEIETEEVAVDETEMSMATVGERGAVTDSEIQKITELNAHTDAQDHAHRPGTAVVMLNKTEDDDVKPPKARGEEDVSAHADKPVANGDTMAIDEDDEDALLRKMMGFTMFKTTHNTKVPGNQIYGVRKEKKTTYRQYMNRVGGFNRPLSPSR